MSNEKSQRRWTGLRLKGHARHGKLHFAPCECGASPENNDGTWTYKRISEWHRQHKAEIVAAAVSDTQQKAK